MTTHGPLTTAYLAAATRYFAGDMGGFADLLAEDCVFDSSNGRVGSSRDEIVAVLEQVRTATGWTGQEIVGSTELGDVAAMAGRNVFADGTVLEVAGILRFADGKVIEMRSVSGVAPAPLS